MATALDPQTAAYIRKLGGALVALKAKVELLSGSQRPLSVQEEIDAIDGRRMEGTLSGSVEFTAADEFSRGAPVTLNVSQDGPFVMTHYPMVVWTPNAPDNTPNLGRWRPVSSGPLPTQQVTTDFIDLMYELIDGGNQRQLQNAPRGPLLSRPDNIVPCPVPTLWTPASVLQFVPTYMAFTWSSDPAPTGGTLHVDIPGYRIVNM